MVADLSCFLWVKIDYDAGCYLLNPAINPTQNDASFYGISSAAYLWALDTTGRDNYVQMRRANAVLFRWL
jgi:hypothetical protein